MTTARKHKKAKTKAKTRKKSRARKAAQKTKPKPTPQPALTTAAAKPRTPPVAPAVTEAPGLRSLISGIFKVSLLAVGVLLLALAALEPSLVGPPRLRKTLIDHRGDLATAGILLLVSMAIAYLIVWGPAI